MFGVMRLEDGRTLGVEDSVFIQDINAWVKRSHPDCSMVAVPKEYINFWKSGYKCEHDGCFEDGSVECRVPAEQDIELIEHFCSDHAYESGYCSLCGDFWGGIESFDFDNPSHLCEHCQDQIKEENCEEDEEDSLWYKSCQN